MSFATITVVEPLNGMVADPTMEPASGTYTDTISVQVEAPDWSSPFRPRRLYTTDDGTQPVADFPVFG